MCFLAIQLPRKPWTFIAIRVVLRALRSHLRVIAHHHEQHCAHIPQGCWWPIQVCPTSKFSQTRNTTKSQGCGTHTLADSTQVYPRGVSSYLTTFLNDDSHTGNRESESDSDDSFFSFSARLHVNEDYQSQPSALVDIQHFSHPPSQPIKPIGKISVRQKNPQTNHMYSSAMTEEEGIGNSPIPRRNTRKENISPVVFVQNRENILFPRR